MKLSFSLLAIVVGCAAVPADEETVPLDKLPRAVAEGFKKRFPDARPTGASKELTEDKKTVFEVTFKEKDRKVDVTLTEAGVITTIEREIDATTLPKAVRDTLETRYPKAKYRIVEEVIAVKDGKESLDYFEALLETAGKKLIEVEVTAEGTIKKTEEKKAEDADKNGSRS